MNRKTTAALLAVSLGLFGYIVVYERGALTGAELEGRQERLFERFARVRVDHIEIERDGNSIVLEKPVLEDGSIGEWRMLSPMQTAADENAINALLGALEWSDARRVFQAEPSEAAQFGLDEPRIRLSLRMGQETLVVAVGNDQEAGGGVYVSDDGGRTIKVAGLDVFEAVDHTAEHFRTKRLSPGGVLTAERLAITLGERVVALVKSEGRWTQDGLFVAAAAVEESLDAITNLEAVNYSASPLGEQTMRVEVRRPANGDIEAATVEVRAGAPCEGLGQVHAQVTFNDEMGPVACVLASSLDALRREPDAWRELRPFTTSNTDLRALRLEREGEVLAVARGDADWSGSVPVDSEALEAWVRELRRSRARDVRRAEEFDAFGLTRPRAILTLTGNAGTEVVRVGNESPEGLFARRNDEAGVVVLDPSFLERLDVSGAAIRPRMVFEGESVESLVIVRDGVREVLEPAAGLDWRVTTPVDRPADRSAVRELIADLLELEAVRFVGPLRAEHALESAHHIVEFSARIEEGAEVAPHRLHVGASSDDGHFARFDEGDVFVIPNVLHTRLERPLVARDTLAVPTYEIDAIAFEGEGRRWSIEQSEGHFRSGGEAVDDELAAQITTALSRLRARPIRYGASAPSEGFGRASWTVTLEGGDVRTVHIGSEDGEGGLLLRMDGLQVTFRAPREALAPLLDATP